MKPKYIIIIAILIILFCLFYDKQYEKFKKKDIKIAIHTVFILKENLPFLEEWIQHHKNIGINKFYLYDNTGSIGRNGSVAGKNKYNINFDKLIKLNNNQIKNEMKKILKKYPEVTYIKWQPKTKEGKIHYGYTESIGHYIKNYGVKNDWTVFIDVDEFLYGNIIKNKNFKNFLKEQDTKNISKIIITQNKYADRFCNINKSVNKINDKIIDINTTGWGMKNIIKNKKLDNSKTPDYSNGPMHNIGIKDNNELLINIDELCFNHYNINKKQINWMKGFFKKDSFKSGKDTENKYNTDINNKKMFNLKYYNKVKNDYCYKF